MTRTVLPSRIVCTKEFYDEILSKNVSLIRQFMRININSREHYKNHIVISKRDFDKILDENPNLTSHADILMAALKRVCEPEDIESEDDSVSRAVEYAIYFSSNKTPFHTIILTTSGKIAEYKANEHYAGMKKVEAWCDQVAIDLIKSYYDACMDKEYY